VGGIPDQILAQENIGVNDENIAVYWDATGLFVLCDLQWRFHDVFLQRKENLSVS